MTDPGERLAVLEQQVQRAIDLIETLRAANRRLTEEREALAQRLEALTTEVGTLRQRDQGLARLEAERKELLEERQQMLGQIEGILKELARIEGL